MCVRATLAAMAGDRTMTTGERATWRAVVLSPLSVERDGLRRAAARSARARGAAGLFNSVEFELTGIGAERVTAAVASLRARPVGRRPSLVVLAGTAGGLTEGPVAPPIARVIDEGGGVWTPAATVRPAEGELATTVLGVDRLIPTPAEKRSLAAWKGATIVDMESHAFARACEGSPTAGVEPVRWAVVRGVSDGPEHELPEFVLGWFDGAGRARPVAMAVGVMAHPRSWAELWRLSRRTRAALAQAGAALAGLLIAERERARAGAG